MTNGHYYFYFFSCCLPVKRYNTAGAKVLTQHVNLRILHIRNFFVDLKQLKRVGVVDGGLVNQLATFIGYLLSIGHSE